MKTDALLYDLFQTFPALFFELIGQEPSLAEGYRFASVEVKQIAFRLDGVLIPNNPAQPRYFLECQFQKDKAIYLRLIAQIAMYVRRENFEGDWQAVVLFGSRSMDPGIPQTYRAFETNGQVQRFYLEEQASQGSLAFGVLDLLRTPKRGLKARVQELLPRVQMEISDPDRRGQIMEMFETVLVAKFPELSRQEIEAMLKVKSLRNTRVFQEGREEGREEGGEQTRLKMIARLASLEVPVEKIAEAAELSVEQVRAILDSQTSPGQ
ncbi:MAG: Rpn family recombination-promoting nuclease/putative transposase [Gemmatimonadaceae bacterium]|nr:Rpn family recombination-promoting nuclease/putative transposase [Gloeobacterales cyanobacterium ES-bin-141]